MPPHPVMSPQGQEKVSPLIRHLINNPRAKPNPVPEPAQIKFFFKNLAVAAARRNVGTRAWATLAAATLTTFNSPESLVVLHRAISSPTPSATVRPLFRRNVEVIDPVTERGVPFSGNSTAEAIPTVPLEPIEAAEFIREVGLKCSSFIGYPRVVNCLTGFRNGLPGRITHGLPTQATRQPSRRPDAFAHAYGRGREIWETMYRPNGNQMVAKLADAHPDLPVHILNSHFAWLLADPPTQTKGIMRLGDIYTHLVAISCLRSQTGTGDHVMHHVVGLKRSLRETMGGRKAINDNGDDYEHGQWWLGGDEGTEWILKTVDGIRDEFLREELAAKREGQK